MKNNTYQSYFANSKFANASKRVSPFYFADSLCLHQLTNQVDSRLRFAIRSG